MPLIYLLLPIIALLLASAQATWASAIKHQHLFSGTPLQIFVHLITNGRIWLGGFIYALTTVLYFYMLSRIPFFTIQVTVTALAILFSTAIAAYFFHENISPLNLVGVALVILGLGLVMRR